MLMKKKPTTITPTVSTFTFDNKPVHEYAVKGENVFDIRMLTFTDKPNDPWFVAADVCRALDFYIRGDGRVNTSMAVSNLDADELAKLSYVEAKNSGLQNIASRSHGLLLFSESGLYKLIMRANPSEKPRVKKFQDWVTRDVLPAIRKDGMYVKGEEKVLTGEMSMEEMTLKVLEGLQSKVSRLTAEKDALTEDVTRKQFVIEEMHDQVGALAEDNAALEAVKAEMEPMVASSIPCKFWY